jgi:8-oxo-dGTP pyrophosphatase MutT (NUDIX family)
MTLYYPNRKFPGKETRIAGIVVFSMPDEKVLILETTKGKLDLPKGHVEEGETFLQGALRETFEETGLHHRKNLEVFPYHYISLPSKKWLRFYLGYTPEKRIKLMPEEHLNYHWLSPQQAIREFGPANQFSDVIEAMCVLKRN